MRLNREHCNGARGLPQLLLPPFTFSPYLSQPNPAHNLLRLYSLALTLHNQLADLRVKITI